MKKKQLETLLYSVAGVIAMGLIIVAANVIFGVAKQHTPMRGVAKASRKSRRKEV